MGFNSGFKGLREVYSFVEILSIKFVSYTVSKRGTIKDYEVK